MTKNIIITGALESGIGESIRDRMLKEGYYVIGTYEKNKTEIANKFVNKKNISLYEVDHSNKESIQNFVNKLKTTKIDGFVNAQMYFNMENLNNFDHDTFEQSVFINLTMPNYLVRSLITNFNNDSSLVFITSTEGFTGSFGASAYASTKAAIHNLVKTYANNFGDKKIRSNAVAAGWIGGVMDTDEVFNMSREITPLGRLGKPEEVASSVNFLLSQESSFVNGSTLTVDGGYSGVDTISKFEFLSELT